MHQGDQTMSVRQWFVMAAMVISASGFVSKSVFASDRHHGDHSNLDQNRPKALSGSSIYQLDSKWTDQNGKKVTLNDFSGKTLVLSMAYTSCKSACPILVSDMKRIEQALRVSLKGKVQFALFSFDSKNDTPANLRAYAKQHGLDLKEWTLLASDKEAVRQLAAALGIRYKQDSNGEYSHSNVVTVLNSAGEIAFQQIGLRADPKETIEAITNEKHATVTH
jgi:protein SCO1/2